jgi:Ni/Co efflux regulator RcnB
MLYRCILTATALMSASAIDAQVHRSVHRTTTSTVNRTAGPTTQRTTSSVHRTGTAGVHTTTVNRTTNVNVNHAYHPSTWNRARIHAGAYNYPHGYGYQRWAVGRPLPRAFLAPAYYYTGYAALGLAAPPPSYHWVRYGPDLMLVNVTTGNVVDIRYGVFG